MRCNTLYPAAYPRPGNRDVNLLPNGASAYCLKMTLLNAETDVTGELFDISLRHLVSGTLIYRTRPSHLLAIVSTGWKIASSAIPAEPIHDQQRVRVRM